MKPKPLSLLNHLTVPWAILLNFSHSERLYQAHARVNLEFVVGARGCAAGCQRSAGDALKDE